MFKKIINTVLLASVLGLCACDDAGDERPPGVLDKEAFARLLVDFALAESAGSMNVKNVAVNQLDSAYAFNPLKDNQLSASQYSATLAYYSDHGEQYQEVYQMVLAELNRLQTRRDSLKTHAPVKDSAALKAKNDTAKIHPAAK